MYDAEWWLNDYLFLDEKRNTSRASHGTTRRDVTGIFKLDSNGMGGGELISRRHWMAHRGWDLAGTRHPVRISWSHDERWDYPGGTVRIPRKLRDLRPNSFPFSSYWYTSEVRLMKRTQTYRSTYSGGWRGLDCRTPTAIRCLLSLSSGWGKPRGLLASICRVEMCATWVESVCFKWRGHY